MPLTIVNIAYPLVPVSYDTVGGSEQVMVCLDEALVRGGHRSIVVACEGSQVFGELVATPGHPGAADEATWERAYATHHEALRRVLEKVDVDVVHMHGMDAKTKLPDPGPAVLLSLHLPPFNYREEVRNPTRPLTFLACGSQFARNVYPPDPPITVVPYGVPVDRFRPGPPKENFVLALGRICPEKGFHIALDAAKKAGLPLLLGGKVPPFPEHERYFEEEIAPRLDADRRFTGPLPLARRIDLLARARCLVVPSIAAETGPLVALEALACGTPVVARPVGAMPDNLEHGKTALFANDVDDMAQALLDVSRLDPHECRRVACERFSAERMAQDYIDLYERLASLRKNTVGRRPTETGA
jgi:glycosyltransferase involved in cell wall biosynthesis